jgi:hypothetical protein
MSTLVDIERTCVFSLERDADGRVICTDAKWIKGYDFDAGYANLIAVELPQATGPRTTSIHLRVPSGVLQEIETEEMLACLAILLGAIGFECLNDQWTMRCLEHGNLDELVEAVNRSRPGNGRKVSAMSDEDPLPLRITPSERMALEAIRDRGTTTPAGIASIAGKGWAAKDGAGRRKGAAAKESRYSLTEAGRQALAEEEDARRANRPRRR